VEGRVTEDLKCLSLALEETETILLHENVTFEETAEVALVQGLLQETVQEEEYVLGPSSGAAVSVVNQGEWVEYTNLLRVWHKTSIDELKLVLDEHYKTAEKMISQPKSPELRAKMEKLTRQVNDPGEEILDEIYLKLVVSKIKQMPASMKEPWSIAVKQVEYAFSQEVQPIMEQYISKLKDIHKNAKQDVQLKGPSSKISSLASRFEEKQNENPQSKPQPVNKPTASAGSEDSLRSRGGGGQRTRGRRGRLNRFAQRSAFGDMNSGDVQKIVKYSRSNR